MLGILEKISSSELVSNGYISNHNKVRRPRPKFKVSFYLYFCCFWINITQINFENIKRKMQRIISDSCFQFKSWFNVDARAPSIPLLNFPFKPPKCHISHMSYIELNISYCIFHFHVWLIVYAICLPTEKWHRTCPHYSNIIRVSLAVYCIDVGIILH